jgi:glycine cleavage system aminomethyltransferase T
MLQFAITPSTRLRPSPYFDATVSEGVTAFTTYNHMLMPTSYGDPEGEYWQLVRGVSLWDVACERQVEITGRDAGRLVQALTIRDLGHCAVGQGKYVPLCDHRGTLINDPVLLKLADDCYWLSIADSNIWFWARAIAAERAFEVTVREPDVSPLAVQGPKAEDVIASMFGEWVRDLKYFWFRETRLGEIPLVLARSGWSKQGGFELYLQDQTKGTALWNLVRDAGKAWGIRPGTPNHCERIESGLLSWGADTDDNTNPFEVRLGRYVGLDLPDEVIGVKALRRIHAAGPQRHQLGVSLEGSDSMAPAFRWHPIFRNGRKVGDLTNRTWSYRLQKNVGFALISRDCGPGDSVDVLTDGRSIPGVLTELPFI